MSKKKKILPLVENIDSYSDIEYQETDDSDYINSYKVKNQNQDDYYEHDDYYESEDDKVLYVGDMDNDDDYDDFEHDYNVDDYEGPVQNQQQRYHQADIDRCMDAALLFREINDRGYLLDEEKRYIELIVIEMSKIFIKNINKDTLSAKCREAINQLLTCSSGDVSRA